MALTSMTPAPEATRTDAKICAVVVTYNRLDLLKECVASLREQTRALDNILIVNNGSTDGTREWLDEQTGLQVVHQGNTGGSGGFNTGLKAGCAGGFDWFWCMDDDVITDKTALEMLVNTPVFEQETGFLCSRVNTIGGDEINVPTIYVRPGSNGAPQWGKYLAQGIVKIQIATYVSLMVSVTAVRKAGVPIKEMFIWGDDTEFTYRVSKEFPCYYVGKSVVLHKRVTGEQPTISREPTPGRIRMYRYLMRNNIYWMLREKQVKRLAAFLFAILKEGVASLGRQHAMLRLVTICRGVSSGFFFRPTIDFPSA